MRRYLPIILTLSIIKLIIQLVGNKNYGFHRDELLHLSVSEHLDWGYMEFPPLIALIGKISYLLFDYSLMGVRIFPALAGIGILVLCCLIVKEMGGDLKAAFLAGVCILAFIPFYRNHTLFQPVAFDQFFWTLGFYLIIRFVNSQNKNFLLLLGIVFGLGLMCKYTILVWAFGLFVGFFFYQNGNLFRNKWLYFSALIALLMFLPNIIWQAKNNFPIIRHLSALSDNHLSEIDRFSFLFGQIEIPQIFIMIMLGLFGLIFSRKLSAYRFLGVSALIIFSVMWILNAKTYYVFALYPLLFAGGAVLIENVFRKRSYWVYIIGASIIIPLVYFIPEGTPVLPIDRYVKYMGLEEENGRYELTGDYADMFGWEEKVNLADSVYRTLSPSEQANCVLWAENYGEAGALKILGKKYNLPDPISRHGSFWKWGYGNKNAAVWISLGNEKPSVEYVFEEVTLVKIITHKYAIGEENGIPLYICRKPKVNIPQWWSDYEDHIFN